jgi:hypothetical protein
MSVVIKITPSWSSSKKNSRADTTNDFMVTRMGGVSLHVTKRRSNVS